MRIKMKFFFQHDIFQPSKDRNAVRGSAFILKLLLQRQPFFTRNNSEFNKAVNRCGWRLPINPVNQGGKNNKEDKAMFHSSIEDKHSPVIYQEINRSQVNFEKARSHYSIKQHLLFFDQQPQSFDQRAGLYKIFALILQRTNKLAVSS